MVQLAVMLLFFANLLTTSHSRTVPRTERARLMQSTTTRAAAAFSVAACSLWTQQPAFAKVFIDSATYGDRELTIATINKCKQKLRNAILTDSSLASTFLKIAISDALGYDMATGEGGPDGSIILDAEKRRQENSGLEKGLAAIDKVKKELQRTNAISFSDVVVFAGGEALEALGSPRVTVQVGRVDAKEPNDKSGINWSEGGSGEEILSAFKSSGMNPVDTALLLGKDGVARRGLQRKCSMIPNSTFAYCIYDMKYL